MFYFQVCDSSLLATGRTHFFASAFVLVSMVRGIICAIKHAAKMIPLRSSGDEHNIGFKSGDLNQRHLFFTFYTFHFSLFTFHLKMFPPLRRHRMNLSTRRMQCNPIFLRHHLTDDVHAIHKTDFVQIFWINSE